MTKLEKLLHKLFHQEFDSNFLFKDMLWLLQTLGYEYRIRGSHYIFKKAKSKEIINLQKDGRYVKMYQIRQVRKIIQKENFPE